MSILQQALTNPQKKIFWWVNDFLAIVITVSVIAIFLETVPALRSQYGHVFYWIDIASAVIFSVEYILYIIISKKKLKYIFSFYGIIDLLSFLPTYLSLFSLQFLKVLRTTRLFRLLRMFRLIKVITIMQQRITTESKAMNVLRLNVSIYFFFLFILILISSIVLFELEQGAVGTQITTIQDAIWTTLSVLSSVGFGDVFPVTFAGRLFTGLIMFLGVGFLSFAVVIFGKFIQKILFGVDLEEEIHLLEK